MLARIAETVSGASYGALLSELFFMPLGMRDTTFCPSEEQWSRLTPVHKRIAGQDIEVDFRHTLFRGFPVSYEAGGAALASTAADMAVFLSMLACKGVYAGTHVLKEDSVTYMLSPKLPRGLPGLTRGENRGFGCIVHDGAGRLPRRHCRMPRRIRHARADFSRPANRRYPAQEFLRRYVGKSPCRACV